MNQPDLPILRTARLTLYVPTIADAASYAEYYGRNSDHLRPWEPSHADDIDQTAFWERLLPLYRDEYLGGYGARFAMHLTDEPAGPLVGICNIMQIQRGASLSCVLGYSIDAAQTGKGYMIEALRAVVAYCFGPLQLHRIQATYMPTNVRSARILRKLGFVVEGYARDYLFIDRRWRDHLLVALNNRDHAHLSDYSAPLTERPPADAEVIHE